MIVVNTRNHWVKSSIFRVPFKTVTTLVAPFLALFSGDLTVESERSR